MHRLVHQSAVAVLVAFALTWTSSSSAAQWLKYPTGGVARKADQTVDLSAPTPRMSDGKPDFSGIWLTGNPLCKEGVNPVTYTCGLELPMGREGINMGSSLPGGLPYQPWLAELVKKRTAENAKEDPHVRCLPDPFLRAYSLPHFVKFVQTPGLLIMLIEMNANYRQVFMDGRPLPEDPVPSWQGYSSAKWDGDTLVIDSIGFRDDLWIDWNGSVITSAAKVQERIRRPDFGHLEIDLTIEDPNAYTKPWIVTLKQQIAVDTELVDEICLENEKSYQRMR